MLRCLATLTLASNPATETLCMPPQLPENAELTGITARFENGVLTVRVPKAIPVEPEVTEIPIADGDDNTIDI